MREGFARGENFNQASFTLPEWFDADGIEAEFIEDFRGVLFLRAEDGSLFASQGLRFWKRGESLSAVPVIVVPEYLVLSSACIGAIQGHNLGSGLACCALPGQG